MKKIIMTAAIVSSLLFGEAMMAVVFGFVMVSGLMAGSIMSESAREMVECPALVFKPSARKLHTPPAE